MNGDIGKATYLVDCAQDRGYPNSLLSQWRLLLEQRHKPEIPKPSIHPLSALPYKHSVADEEEPIFDIVFSDDIRQAMITSIQDVLSIPHQSPMEEELVSACDSLLGSIDYFNSKITIDGHILDVVKKSGFFLTKFSYSGTSYFEHHPDLRAALSEGLIHSWSDHFLRNGLSEMIKGSRSCNFMLERHANIRIMHLYQEPLLDKANIQISDLLRGHDISVHHVFTSLLDHTVSVDNRHVDIEEFLYHEIIAQRSIIVSMRPVSISQSAIILAKQQLGRKEAVYGHYQAVNQNIIRNFPFSYCNALVKVITGDVLVCHPADLLEIMEKLKEYKTNEGFFQALVIELWRSDVSFRIIDEILYCQLKSDDNGLSTSTFWSPFYPNFDQKESIGCKVRADSLAIWKQHLSFHSHCQWTFYDNFVAPVGIESLSVGVIIPFRDKPDLLRDCVESIFSRQEAISIKVLAVNNGSIEDETFSAISELASKYNGSFSVLDCNEPFNYSRLNNLGSEILNTDYFLLLNNDIVIHSDFCIGHLLSNHLFYNASITGCILYYPSGRIQHNGLAVTPLSHIAVVSPLKGSSPPSDILDAESSHPYSTLFRTHECSAVTAACMLVKRSDYVASGGLDEKLAVAYNDVDFCLRLHHIYPNRPIICVTDVLIEHRESETRGIDKSKEAIARLHRERVLLCDKHTKTFQEPDIFHSQILSSDSLQQTGYDIGIASHNPKIDTACLYEHRDYCQRTKRFASIFVHYDPNGQLSLNCLRYLSELSQHSDIFFVSSSRLLVQNEEAINSLKMVCSNILVRSNSGYDFGCWSHAIQKNYQYLCEYEAVLLCNDSVIAGFSDLGNFFELSMSIDCDFIGMTASLTPTWHLQSYFVFYKRQLFCSDLFRCHWADIRVLGSKYHIIMNYEVEWSTVLRRLGFRGRSFYDKMISHENPTHMFWKELLLEGYPFIKKELIRDNPLSCDLHDLEDMVQTINPSIISDLRDYANSCDDPAYIFRNKELPES
jgi:GT2 family glycosyltransferase